MKNDLRISRSRKLATVAVALVTAIIAACSDAAAPSTAPSADRDLSPEVESAILRATTMSFSLPESFVAQGLLREKPLAKPITVTKVIKRDGGDIDVPGTDFKLHVPRNAFLSSSMTITVTALAGAAVAYDFQPHGVHFLAPLTFKQKVGHTNLHGVKLPSGFQYDISGVYFQDASLLDQVTGIVVGAELLHAEVNGTWSGDELTFPIWHFSGYMASTGRR